MSLSLSIITICFNNLEELKATCFSVDQQTLLPYEHWIIDGSTSPDIRNYLLSTPQPSYRRWLSERDSGIADAFNKGVQRATGDILNMLNSGDYYTNEQTLTEVSDPFNKHPSITWLHSKYKIQRGGLWVEIGKPFEKKKLYRGMRSLSHQSMFVKKLLHDKYGLYDTSLSNAMDYDFVCRISSEPYLFIDKPLVVFVPGGTTYTNYLKALKEGKKVYEKYFGRSVRLVAWQARLKLLYFLLNSPIGRFLYWVKVKLKMENV